MFISSYYVGAHRGAISHSSAVNLYFLSKRVLIVREGFVELIN